MTLFKIKNTSFKLDFFMVLLSFLWIISGNVLTLLTMFLAVFLHESAHIFSAKALGLTTETVTLYIFGGNAEIKGIEDNYIIECIVALFGPLASVFTGFLWQTGVNLNILPAWQEFVDYSYCIALINLIPVYPLDGGRILSSVLKGAFGVKKGKKILNVVSVTFSSMFLIKNIASLIMFNRASGLVMAIFMFVVSLKSIKNKNHLFLRENKWQKAENIKIIKAYGTESLLNVSKKIIGNDFYIIMIFNERENITGYLTEKQLNDALLINSSFLLNEAFNYQVNEAHQLN